VAILAIPGLIVALIVRLTSRGPAIYRDRRIGVGEREFAMLKFRSMQEDAAELQTGLEERNEAGGVIFKMRDDPRVTPVGRILRRFSIDELPQLWNVLRGEMSLVGPRPLPLRDYELLDTWHRGRYRVLPGITGLWQVSGRSELDFDDLVRLDFFYVENWSIWLDIEIIARTPLAVVRGRGAY
jgi:lipopolysaccharide/colanic/teichoic acid biosynthesis glycosyltransferase